MRGTVLSFSIQTNKGFISGDDGKRYSFLGSDWNLTNSPTQGVRVDFDIEGNHAISIYEDPNATTATQTTKSRTTTGILALLLGGFGINFFYLGAWGWGLLSVLFSWTGIPAIAGLILGIRYLSMTDQEFEKKIKKMQGPFGTIEL
jgi:TM2 domain-containing membrane protein YozV/cold shock CspA family protein